MATTDGQPVVVVTGASGGIGRACVRAFARRGYAVALLARGADGLAGAARDVEETGSKPLFGDVRRSDRNGDTSSGSV